MVRKIKHNINIIVQTDTREKNINYVKTIKLDSRRNKDGVKLLSTEIVTVKPLGCSTSVGDISYRWSFEEEDEWFKSNLALERKDGTDMFSSIYTKANYDRLLREFERGKDADLDMYFLITDNMTELNRKINKIRRFNDNSCKIFFDNYLKLTNYLQENKIPMICTGSDIGWIIRRLIKNNIKKYKINYK